MCTYYALTQAFNRWLNQNNRRREKKYPINTFSIMRQVKQKEMRIIPGTSLAVAEHSLKELSITFNKIGGLWDDQAYHQDLLRHEMNKAGSRFPRIKRSIPSKNFGSPFITGK